jgi:hypothetical protein
MQRLRDQLLIGLPMIFTAPTDRHERKQADALASQRHAAGNTIMAVAAGPGQR